MPGKAKGILIMLTFLTCLQQGVTLHCQTRSDNDRYLCNCTKNSSNYYLENNKSLLERMLVTRREKVWRQLLETSMQYMVWRDHHTTQLVHSQILEDDLDKIPLTFCISTKIDDLLSCIKKEFRLTANYAIGYGPI